MFRIIVHFAIVLLLVAQASAQIGARAGFPVSSGSNAWNPSPALVDIDGDGDLEIIGAGGDGIVYAFDKDGTKLWSFEVPTAGCKSVSINNRLHSSPAIADLDNDGHLEGVIGYGGITSACGGGVVVFNAETGEIKQKINNENVAKKFGFSEKLHSVYSTPAIKDCNGDGLMEVAYGSFDRNIYFLRTKPKGKLAIKFRLHAADTVWSSATFHDIDNDGISELFIGQDISANKYLKPVTKNGGYMNAIKTFTKFKSKSFGFRSSDVIIWQNTFDQTVFSSPIIADVLSSNPGPELIVGTGTYFGSKGAYLKILNLSTGKQLKKLSTAAPSASQAAVADLDGDGDLEVIATVNEGDDSMGHITAFDPETGEHIWTTLNSWGLLGYASPIVADLDGNGSREVIANTAGEVTIFSGIDGSELKKLNVSDSLSTPAVGDLDGDGDLDLVFLGGKKVYVFSGFTGQLGSQATSQTPYGIDIGMFRINPARDGIYQ